MFSKLLLAAAAFTLTTSLGAQTLDFSLASRQAEVNDVDWSGFEYGFAYFFDLNEAVSLGPYLSSTSWNITNDASGAKSSGDHREFGPEIRFLVPMEAVNFLARASYSLISQGTACTESGMTADLGAYGWRFKIGLGIPFDSGFDLNMLLIKGVQTVVLENPDNKATENLDDLALGLSLSF